MGHHISHIRQKQHRTRAARRQRGFTLIEVMVVIAILGILAALVVPKIMSRPDQARRLAAKHDIQTIAQALKLYRLDNGRYPTQEQGLRALIEKPSIAPMPDNWKDGGYLESLPSDPWGPPYQYLNPGIHGEIDIFSYGADGQPGGEGNDADIGSWHKIPECRVYAARSADHTGHCRITHITGELSHLAQSAHSTGRNRRAAGAVIRVRNR